MEFNQCSVKKFWYKKLNQYDFFKNKVYVNSQQQNKLLLGLTDIRNMSVKKIKL